jgi:predicted O-methyltransferase YrrM
MDSSLKSIAKRALPPSALGRIRSVRNVALGHIRSVRNRALAYSHGLMRARTGKIQFYSGLGDSSAILYGLIRSMKPEVCVEIGSARGNSTCSIAAALKENEHGKLYAIDPHMPTDWNDNFSVDTFDILRSNLSALGLTDHVEIIRSRSEEAARDWTRAIDLIFIDGDHSYEGVKRDWDMFVKHVSRFGLVVFHDTIWDLRPLPEVIRTRPAIGVPRFVDELRQLGYPVITLDRDYGVSIVQPIIGGIALR